MAAVAHASAFVTGAIWSGAILQSCAGCKELQGREKTSSDLRKIKLPPKKVKSPKHMHVALCKQLGFHLCLSQVVCWNEGAADGGDASLVLTEASQKFFYTITLAKKLIWPV